MSGVALTTVVGFGGMFTSQHAGLASMGVLCVVGVTFCFLGSVVTLPAVLWTLERFGRSPARPPTPHEVLIAAAPPAALYDEEDEGKTDAP